ncbi:hypothetical protein MO867_20025 [Microbulbifer sp. OS29]|uniref:GST N-terminal domain-containing protein n=2 Tax=Microbulbifer okhotskensis TaxID=2926617 RepID=A0A9X2EQP4_9GAMM|nr:hypothetical protein [Microbulbifer okhotskensis]
MGVEYETILTDRKAVEQKSSEYMRLNPTGRIPKLLDENLIISESDTEF